MSIIDRKAHLCTCLAVLFLLAARIQGANEAPQPEPSLDQEKAFRQYTPTDFIENEELREIINTTDAKKVGCVAFTGMGFGLSLRLHKRFPTTLLKSVGRSSAIMLIPISCYAIHEHMSASKDGETNIE